MPSGPGENESFSLSIASLIEFSLKTGRHGSMAQTGVFPSAVLIKSGLVTSGRKVSWNLLVNNSQISGAVFHSHHCKLLRWGKNDDLRLK